jgi:hypothetical protein
MALVFLQLYFGALVAGLRAGRVFQYLARYRRRLDSIQRAAVLSKTPGGAICSTIRSPCSSSIA